MQFRILLFLVVVSVAVSCGPSANDADATGNFEAEEVVVSAEANGKAPEADAGGRHRAQGRSGGWVC